LAIRTYRREKKKKKTFSTPWGAGEKSEKKDINGQKVKKSGLEGRVWEREGARK